MLRTARGRAIDSVLARRGSRSVGRALRGGVSRTSQILAENGEEWLKGECGLDDAGAKQAIAYVRAGSSALGALPACDTIVAERFFDEAGGMQLVLHAPFGSRVNRAWGLALRKRFCRTFNFELQAAATDNGIVISLSDRHAFPLELVFEFLKTETVRDVLDAGDAGCADVWNAVAMERHTRARDYAVSRRSESSGADSENALG